MVDVLDHHQSDDATTRESAADSLRKALQNVQSRLDRLLDLRISPANTDGTILSDDEYATRRASFLKEKEGLERELHNATSVGEADWIAARNGALRFGSHVSCWLAQGDPQQKRVILSALGSNLAIRDQMVAITLENPLLLGLERTVREIPETGASLGGFEPRKSGGLKAQSRHLAAYIPTLLRIWNEVRTRFFESVKFWQLPSFELTCSHSKAAHEDGQEKAA